MTVPVSQGLGALLGRYRRAIGVHPGLLLDKYPESYGLTERGKFSEMVQRVTLQEVVRASQVEPPGLGFAALRDRHESMLTAVPGLSRWTAQAGAPLALHLSRASALENAGTCLHPIYGFAFLPGSGLKGMAHAYACEIWLPTQENRDTAWGQICQVFGVAPSPWLKRLAIRLGRPAPGQACAGAVVFHDAWPTRWPTLQMDIVNNHHREYYQGTGPAPGDWESPVPTYFLVVRPGSEFSFSLTPRRTDQDERWIALAREWMEGALLHLGCGGKTGAGYGWFGTEAVGESVELELITPAFLAGALQEQAECDLRPATLRGLLRWWWRTLHAGHLAVAQLRALEAALWGDTKSGGAVQVRVQAVGPQRTELFNKATVQQDYSLPKPPDNKTTQGLSYLAYGMDDHVGQGAARRRKQRPYLTPGARWRVTLTARATTYLAAPEGRAIAAGVVMEQAKAALWLLCQYGGIGAKSRKGFGSVQVDMEGFGLKKCEADAATLRQELKLNQGAMLMGSCALSTGRLCEVGIPWLEPWVILDHAGFAYQAFAKRYKHKEEKSALGLPRKIHRNPSTDLMVPLPGRHGVSMARHAAPIHIHIARERDGRMLVRVLAFPTRWLPEPTTSKTMLDNFLVSFKKELTARSSQLALAGRRPPPALASSPVHPSLRPPGTKVTVKILAVRPKGGYQVKEENHPEGVLNQGPEPEPAPEPGATVQAYLRFDNARSPEYRWDAPAPTNDPAAPRSRDHAPQRPRHR